jgi:hypothetical protein
MSYKCEPCNYATNYTTHYKVHVSSKKHAKRTGVYTNDSFKLNAPDFKKNKEILKSGASNSYCEDNSKEILKSNLVERGIIGLDDTDKICKYCGIEIENNSSLNRHIKDCDFQQFYNSNDFKYDESTYKKIKLLRCPKCDLECNRKCSLIRHMKLCIANKHKKRMKYKELKDKLEETQNKLDSLQKEKEKEIMSEKLKSYEKITEILEKQNKVSNEVAVVNSYNVMRTINFLNKYATNAPKLQNFMDEFEDPYIFYIDYDEHEKIKKEVEEKKKPLELVYYDKDKMTKDEYIVDHICFLQETKQTVKYLAERLVHFYKKENEPAKQSIWNIDMYRHNFTVSLESEGKVIWHSDKQGQTTSEKILNPLLEFTTGIIKKHMEVLQSNMMEYAKAKKTSEVVNIVNKMNLLAQFIMSVNKNELQQEIIKKISPLLFFEQKNKDEIYSEVD